MLVAQIGDEREKLRKFREIIFPENKQQFHRQRFIPKEVAEKLKERVLRPGGFREFFSIFRRLLEQSHELLELVEDEEGRAAFVVGSKAHTDIRRGKNKAGAGFVVPGKARWEERGRAFLGQGDTFHHELG